MLLPGLYDHHLHLFSLAGGDCARFLADRHRSPIRRRLRGRLHPRRTGERLDPWRGLSRGGRGRISIARRSTH